jgi:hypothetical protein
VRFHVPADYLHRSRAEVQFLRLSRQTAVHDVIRADLAAAGLLNHTYLSNPYLLGTVSQMGGAAAEAFVGRHRNKYLARWTDSLTLRPFDSSVGTLRADDDGTLVSLRMGPPSLLAFVARW